MTCLTNSEKWKLQKWALYSLPAELKIVLSTSWLARFCFEQYNMCDWFRSCIYERVFDLGITSLCLVPVQCLLCCNQFALVFYLFIFKSDCGFSLLGFSFCGNQKLCHLFNSSFRSISEPRSKWCVNRQDMSLQKSLYKIKRESWK